MTAKYKKYTAILREDYASGSHHYTLVNIKRFKVFPNETMVESLDRNEIKYSTVFIFKGWPKLEDEVTIKNIETEV